MGNFFSKSLLLLIIFIMMSSLVIQNVLAFDKVEATNSYGIRYHDGYFYTGYRSSLDTYSIKRISDDGSSEVVIENASTNYQKPITGIAFDSDGNMYYAVKDIYYFDSVYRVLKKDLPTLENPVPLDPSEDSSKLTTILRGFKSIYDLAFSPEGDLYFTDWGDDNLYKISKTDLNEFPINNTDTNKVINISTKRLNGISFDKEGNMFFTIQGQNGGASKVLKSDLSDNRIDFSDPNEVKNFITSNELGGMYYGITVNDTDEIYYSDHFYINKYKPIVHSIIDPTNTLFMKNTGSDIPVTMTLNGNTLQVIYNGSNPLILGTDYTLEGNTVKIKKEYLAQQEVGQVRLVFLFSQGNPQFLGITIQESTTQNSTITPTTATFDKKEANQDDIPVTMTLNGNTLQSIYNGPNELVLGTDYTLEDNTVKVKKEYLAQQEVGQETLTFKFSAGVSQDLVITVKDDTPQTSYNVTYHGNNHTAGSVPADNNTYQQGETVSVHGNTGNLVRTGYNFIGWNTSADGSGTNYPVNETFKMGTSNVSLYAKWVPLSPNPGGDNGTPPSNNGGNGDSSNSGQSNQEIITVPVDTGNIGNSTTVMQTPITRTTESNGKITDDVILTPDRAKDTVKFVKELGQNTARIVIPDEKDKVSKVIVNVPKEATKEVKENNINLEIYTENVRIAIPQQSLKTFEDDLYFRLIPMKEESERQEVEERAKKEEIIQEAAKNQTVQVLGRPMEIETNMQSREVSLVLPLKNSLPADAKERQKMLDNLGIYVEHSDGTKELLRGKVVPYKNETELGLEFTVSKFSTFTIVYMEGAQAFFDGKTCGKDKAIGCVSAKKSVPLYEQVNNRLKKVDVLKSGKWDPAYEVISPMLGLGGDIWVERTDAILYETPSKEMLAKNAATGSKRIKQTWKGFEMHPGQIGKVTVLKDTVIWEKINKTKKLPRILKKGEQYRVYRYVPGMYNLGIGKYVVQDDYVIFKSLK
ncbi:X2-like carbohydrate binding domain-containing protein [Cytobacillus praedii]|uniref:X2-like carbohydrate binding domain-containing protein n=1 Tax=Cytobacillus praedii TaxID=1742358 RepID=UPI003AF93261